MKNTYPRSLAGLFELNMDDRVLKPVRMIDTLSTDNALKEIRFNKNKTADAEFENGVCVNFPVKWDGIDDSYSFHYNGHPHGFSMKKNLGEELKYVDVMSITDIDPDHL
jgi:hypothetical protein